MCYIYHTCKDAGSQDLVEHDDGDTDLEGRGPEHVEVGRHVRNPLAVHRHQVHNLARGGVLASRGGHTEALPATTKTIGSFT